MLEIQTTTENQTLPQVQEAAPKPQPVEERFYPFQSHHFGQGLKLKEIARLFELKPVVFNPTCLAYELSPTSFCLFYNFGSAVFFNVTLEVQKTTLQRIQDFLGSKEEPVTADEFLLEEKRRAKNTVSFDKVVVDKLSREKIELIALILAQSTALEFFEKKVDDILSRLGTQIAQLGKKSRLSEKKIIALIEQVLGTKQDLIATLCLLEKPEETWDNKTLDDLHQEGTRMFELKERFRTLDYKLKTIQENLELLSNFATNRQHLLLEVTIVALIVLEVVLFSYELFLK